MQSLILYMCDTSLAFTIISHAVTQWNAKAEMFSAFWWQSRQNVGTCDEAWAVPPVPRFHPIPNWESEPRFHSFKESGTRKRRFLMFFFESLGTGSDSEPSFFLTEPAPEIVFWYPNSKEKGQQDDNSGYLRSPLGWNICPWPRCLCPWTSHLCTFFIQR